MIRVINRQLAQLFGEQKVQILLLSAEKRVNAHPQRIGKLRQNLCVGRAAAFPFGNRLRGDANQISELFLRIFLLISEFLNLFPNRTHFQPPVDFSFIITNRRAFVYIMYFIRIM